MAIKRIAPSGGDYTTLSAWYASLPSTLTEPEIAELESFDLVEQFTGGSKNTTAANYIEIRAAAGHGHNGVPGTGARIRCGSTPTLPVIYITATHFRFTGIEIYMDKVGGTQEAFNLVNASPESDVRVNGCIIRSVCTDTGVPAVSIGNGVVTFTNNIVVSACRSLDSRAASSAKIFNNVFWRTADAIGCLNDANSEVRNNYSGASAGASQCFFTSSGGVGSHNASSDTTATTLYATGSIASLAGTSAFTNVATLDFTLATGSALKDAGTTVATVTTDIIGASRPQNSIYDIGAYEVVSGAPNTAPSFDGPSISNITGNVGVAITPVDVSSRFSDAESGLTFSAVGSWPTGITVSSVGVISGTPTVAGSFTGLAVRATDTGSLTADSNSFSITVAAAGITLADPIKNNTGTVQANKSSIRVAVLRSADLVSVFETSGIATDASGMLETISDAAIISGQQYHVVIKLADNGIGISSSVTAS